MTWRDVFIAFGVLCALGLFVIGLASMIGTWTAYDDSEIDDMGETR